MLKSIKSYIAVVLVVLLAFSFVPSSHVHAGVDRQLQDECAAVLVKLKLMLGDNSGNLHLDRKITRSEFVTLVIRMMGYDTDTQLQNISLSFGDSAQISNWARDYIKIALKYGLIKGYNDNTVRPNQVVTNAEAQTVILRALGYEGTLTGGWPGNVMDKAALLGLCNSFDLSDDHRLTRGETAVLLYNALMVDFYDE